MQEINNAIGSLNTGSTDTTETNERATTMLNELDEARASLPAIRAQALIRKQGKFDKAIADAYKAIDACPTSGELYLVASQLHIAHGKPKLAVKVLEDGLRLTLPSHWPALYDEREAAKRLLTAKVDFVSILPAEITAKIFECLYSEEYGDEDLLPCTLVSKSWRAAVLSCPDLWKFALYEQNNVNSTFQLLPSVASYVEKLAINELPERPTQYLVAFAARDMLQSVTKLWLGVSYFSGIHLNLSLAFASQLTEIKIHTCDEDEDTAFPLDLVLVTFKNLRVLVVASKQEIQYRPFPPQLMDTLKLEMLSIYTSSGDYGFLQRFIHQCGSLRFLNVPRCSRATLELAAEHCLQLEELYICDASDYCDISVEACNGHRQPTTGLRILEYWPDDSLDKLRGLMPLWARSKNTLQELGLAFDNGDLGAIESAQWDLLVSFPHPQVKSLSLDVTDNNDGHVLHQVLRLLVSCPALEDVNITFHGLSSGDFFTGFTGLPYLRRLQLSGLCNSDGERQHDFEYLSAYNESCNLKEISFTHCDAVNDQILNALAGTPSLEYIHIDGYHPQISSSGIMAFLEKLKSNPNIKYLRIDRMIHFTEDCAAKVEELVKLDQPGNMYSLKKSEQQPLDHTRRLYNITLERIKHF